eukprot:COSAG04_NODE_3148_length_3121_cov_2.309398_2_plen_372_part_00
MSSSGETEMGAAVSDLSTAKDALSVLSKHTKVPAERLLALSAAELHELALKIDGLDVSALAERADEIGIPQEDVAKAMEGRHATGALLELMVHKARENEAVSDAKDAKAARIEHIVGATAEPEPEPREPEPREPEPMPEPEPPKTLSFKPDPAVLKAAQEKRKAAHARAAAERAAAEAEEDSEEDEGPCPGDATSSDSEDEDEAEAEAQPEAEADASESAHHGSYADDLNARFPLSATNAYFPMYVVQGSVLRKLKRLVPHEEAQAQGLLRKVVRVEDGEKSNRVLVLAPIRKGGQEERVFDTQYYFISHRRWQLAAHARIVALRRARSVHSSHCMARGAAQARGLPFPAGRNRERMPRGDEFTLALDAPT